MIELTASEAHFANQDEYEPHVRPSSVAAWHHDHGDPVFPIKRGTKEPACKWLEFRSTHDLAASFVSYGVWLLYLLVVDADCPATAAWMAAHLPWTPFRVRTGPYHDGSLGRGEHWYYLRGEPRPSYIYRDGLTIECRNGNLYVLGAGSRHPSGAIYTASDWSWQRADIPTFPADFLFDDGSCGTRTTTGAVGDAFVFPDFVRAGERHAVLFRQIRSWRYVFNRSEAREGIHLMNLAHCQPPLPEDDAFEAWFTRVWNQADRPLPAAAGITPVSNLRGVSSSLRSLRGL